MLVEVVINDRGMPMELSQICMVFDSTLRCGGGKKSFDRVLRSFLFVSSQSEDDTITITLYWMESLELRMAQASSSIPKSGATISSKCARSS